jgi:hypothetical protein
MCMHMDDDHISAASLDAIRRMLRHLPQQNDLTLIVLKSHLLIEQQMMDVVRKRAPADEVKKIERLKFFPLTRVTRALIEREAVAEDRWDDDWWEAIDLLNTLRNRLAHRLEAADAKTLAEQFVTLVSADYPDWFGGGIERIVGPDRSLEAKCKACVAILCTALSDFI